jgi:hypothetical protein
MNSKELAVTELFQLTGDQRLIQEFDADLMVSLPYHPALSARLRPSCQMEHEVLREIINVANCEARTHLTHVDQGAPFKNAIRCPLDPSVLIDRSPKEQTPIEEIRAHGATDRRLKLMRYSACPAKVVVNCQFQFSKQVFGACAGRGGARPRLRDSICGGSGRARCAGNGWKPMSAPTQPG